MENNYEYSSVSEGPVGNDKLLAILSYLGLWIIGILSNPEKEHEYLRNHIKNAIILDVCFLICSIIPFVGWICDVALLVITIIGIVKACKNEQYTLPLFGKMFPTLNTNKVMSVFCYVSCGWAYALVCSPEKDDPIVKSHMNNGILIDLFAIICAIIPVVGWIIDIVLLVFAIIGIVKACKGEAYTVPVIGEKFQIIK